MRSGRDARAYDLNKHANATERDKCDRKHMHHTKARATAVEEPTQQSSHEGCVHDVRQARNHNLSHLQVHNHTQQLVLLMIYGDTPLCQAHELSSLSVRLGVPGTHSDPAAVA